MTNASLWILSFLPCLYQYAGFLPFTFDQYKDRGISLFSEVEALDVPLDSCLIDRKTCVEQEVTTNAVIEEMLWDFQSVNAK